MMIFLLGSGSDARLAFLSWRFTMSHCEFLDHVFCVESHIWEG